MTSTRERCGGKPGEPNFEDREKPGDMHWGYEWHGFNTATHGCILRGCKPCPGCHSCAPSKWCEHDLELCAWPNQHVHKLDGSLCVPEKKEKCHTCGSEDGAARWVGQNLPPRIQFHTHIAWHRWGDDCESMGCVPCQDSTHDAKEQGSGDAAGSESPASVKPGDRQDRDAAAQSNSPDPSPIFAEVARELSQLGWRLKINDVALDALHRFLMCDDPHTIHDPIRKYLEDFADRVAQNKGFTDWVHQYHERE